MRWWALGLGVVFALSGTAWTAALAPLNKLWTKLGVLLYRVVSPLVLGLLFYVTVTPIALLMRVLGKDPLRLRRDPDAASYWIVRTPRRAGAQIHEEPVLSTCYLFYANSRCFCACARNIG